MPERIPVPLFGDADTDREHLRLFHGIDTTGMPASVLFKVHTAHHFKTALNDGALPIPHYHRNPEAKRPAEPENDDQALGLETGD